MDEKSDDPLRAQSRGSTAVWQRAIIIFAGVVTGFILILCLQWGRPILIPISLALLLTFLLNPIVKFLHRRGIGQILSVMIAVTTSGILLLGLTLMVSLQVSSLLDVLPENTAKIKVKIQSLKKLTSGPTQEKIGQMFEELSEEINVTSNQNIQNQSEVDFVRTGDEAGPANRALIVRSESPQWLNLTQYVGSAFESLASLAFVMVLLVFFLIEREDLRDRIVLLAGRARLAVTSKAMEDVTDRISRYIGMVAIINGGFGVVLAAVVCHG